MKDRGFKFLIALSFLFFIADFATTFMTGELKKHLEVNPIYLLTGSFLPIILLNLVVFGFTLYYYLRNRSSPFIRYTLITYHTVLCIVRVVAIRNAIFWIQNPITVEVAAQVYTEAVKVAYLSELAYIIYAPILINIVTYFVFRIDHEIKRK